MKGFPYPGTKVTNTGYRKDSPDVNNKQNIIPSNKISMSENDGKPLEKGKIVGEGLTTGKKKIMKPGKDYSFPGDKAVLETPLKKPDVRRTIGPGKNFNKAKPTGTGAAAGGGMTQKGVDEYKRKNPGSKLKTAVTTPPSKLKKGSKAANRRKSFCARSRGWTGERGRAARRRWNC